MIAVATPPKLRSDLVIRRQETSGEKVFVVKVSKTQRYFNLGEAEHFIARQLDGETSLETVCQRAERQFGAALSRQNLDEFVDKLQHMQLLEAEDATTEKVSWRRGRIRGNVLYLRWRAFDPDRLFDWLVGKVRFLFSPSFVAFSAALILLALGTYAANSETIGRELAGLYRFDALLLAWVVLVAIIVLHEFAHGLTCKWFGGEVHELGFMLLYFQPAMYCNVSDAWLFPEKSRRLWVTFAGAYFEMFLWALATLIWRLTDPNTALNYLAFVVMLTSGIKTLFNLNPLIKLDGYYLLSDYLEIANLRWKAFAYLSARIKRCFGAALQTAEAEATTRERRIYLLYGTAAAAFSIWLMGWIALSLGGLLVNRYQGFGFVLFTCFLAIMFQRPLTILVAKPVGWSRSVLSRLGLRRRTALWLVLLAGLSALMFFGRMELTVAAPFSIVPIRHMDVRTEVEAIIDELFVDEGDVVSEGDLIARLSDLDYRADLNSVEAETAVEQATLKMLKAGPRIEEVELATTELETAATRQTHAQQRYEVAQRVHAERVAKARTTIKKAEEQLEFASKELAEYRRLSERGSYTPKELRAAEAQAALRERELQETQADLNTLLADDLAAYREEIRVAQKELEESQRRLELLLAGSRPEMIEASAAKIARLDVRRQHLTQQLELLRVSSPITGVITTPKLKEKVGQLVEKGDLIACVQELKTVKAEIAVPEKEIGDVRLGQQVVLKCRAYPGQEFRGLVASIASSATTNDEPSYGRTILVIVLLDNPLNSLKPEMTGHAKIHCGRQRLFDIASRRLVRYIRVEFWSWW